MNWLNLALSKCLFLPRFCIFAHTLLLSVTLPALLALPPLFIYSAFLLVSSSSLQTAICSSVNGSGLFDCDVVGLRSVCTATVVLSAYQPAT